MEKKKKRYQVILRIAGFVCCLLTLLALSTMILKPKRLEKPYDNTRKERGFYLEPRDSLDVVFIGSSQAFSTIMPSVLAEEQGLHSYVFAGNEQTFSISYYYMMEVLKYQKPKAVVLETTFCNWGEVPREAVVRINFDDIRWGKAKILGIMNNVPPAEWEYYFFELAKYHSRWDSLTTQDFDFIGAYRETDPDKGWSSFGKSTDPKKMYGPEIKEEILTCTERRPIDQTALQWLERMDELCREKGVKLILVKTPNEGKIIEPVTDEASEDAFRYVDGMPYYNWLGAYAKQKDIPFLNMNLVMTGTNHNDYENAAKATSYLGSWLADEIE